MIVFADVFTFLIFFVIAALFTDVMVFLVAEARATTLKFILVSIFWPVIWVATIVFCLGALITGTAKYFVKGKFTEELKDLLEPITNYLRQRSIKRHEKQI